MVTKKGLAIAVLATFCLTVTLFLIIPIKSANNPYDPWIDFNDDGKIGLADLSALAGSYGTTGDPAKNVTVTNLRDYDLQYGTFNMSSSYTMGGPPIFCGGYSRLSLLLMGGNASTGVSGVIVNLDSLWWRPTLHGSSSNNTQAVEYPGGKHPGISTNYTWIDGQWWTMGGFTYITEVKAPYCLLIFTVDWGTKTPPTNWWVTFNYCVYLRNE